MCINRNVFQWIYLGKKSILLQFRLAKSYYMDGHIYFRIAMLQNIEKDLCGFYIYVQKSLTHLYHIHYPPHSFLDLYFAL